MTHLAGLRDGLRLMRPAQWPILTIQLALSMALAAPVADAGRQQWWSGLDLLRLAYAWVIWVVLLNGGTLAFNSAYDRDTGPVAYLRHPPAPPEGLTRVALVVMILGCILGLVLVGWFFGLVVGGCVVLSVLYSHPATRWKSLPGLDLVVNIAGYGAGTTLAGLSAAGGGAPAGSGWWFAGGFGLLFGSFYPLTQIYQTTADRARGDRTLTTALGVQASLLVALGLGLAGGSALFAGCYRAARGDLASVLVAALCVWCGHLVWWLLRSDDWSDGRHERGMYQALGLWGLVDAALAVAWLAG